MVLDADRKFKALLRRPLGSAPLPAATPRHRAAWTCSSGCRGVGLTGIPRGEGLGKGAWGALSQTTENRKAERTSDTILSFCR